MSGTGWERLEGGEGVMFWRKGESWGTGGVFDGFCLLSDMISLS